jgi:hypothetical protein
MEMKGALFPKINPMKIIFEGLRSSLPPNDKYEEKKLREWDEIRSGKLTLIFSRKEKK